jgi:nucleoside-diphosphate-sugar epimerase
MERVVPLFIYRIRNKLPITIFGRDKVLDFTYVDDCIAGVRAGIDLLLQGEEGNQTINLAYGQGNSLVAMAHYVGEALGEEPDMTVSESRVGEVTHYVANIGKARALLDYSPQTPLREGIDKAVGWCTNWWDRRGGA